jgi:hypothetical protein
MSDVSNNQVPDDISYDASDVKRASARPNLRLTGTNERYKFVVSAPAKKSVNEKSGNFTLQLELRPLDSENTPKTPSIRFQLFPPMPNKERENHKAPNTMGLCRSYLEAVGAEGVKKTPKWNSDAQGWVREDGSVIPQSQKAAADAEIEAANMTVFEAMRARWKDPSLFERDCFFGSVILDKKTQKYRNVDRISGELPGDCTQVTEGFAEYSE